MPSMSCCHCQDSHTHPVESMHFHTGHSKTISYSFCLFHETFMATLSSSKIKTPPSSVVSYTAFFLSLKLDTVLKLREMHLDISLTFEVAPSESFQ